MAEEFHDRAGINWQDPACIHQLLLATKKPPEESAARSRHYTARWNARLSVQGNGSRDAAGPAGMRYAWQTKQ